MKTNALQTNALSKPMAPSQGSRSRFLHKLHPRSCRAILFASALIFGLICGGSSAAFAQATGQISGEITDPSGRVVPAARIELTNTSTGDVRTVVSGSNGSFTVPLVNPGVYQVRVQVKGFRTSVTNNVQVEVNSTSKVDVKLQLGEASEQVTVTDTAPLVETGNAAMGEVVDHQQIVDLPLNGRNFAQLGTLIPGVVAAPAAVGGANGNATVGGFGNTTGSFNVNGMRNQSNNFLLDGAPNNDSFNSGFVMRPPPDAIEEFKIITHSYEAEYGRNAGSVVNVVTRSGTNKYHGSVWEFNREAAYAARNWFSTAASGKPDYILNQFGVYLGGPIIKDKLFLSGYYEGFRNKDATSNVLNVPVLSSAERTGNFTELLTSATGTCGAVGVTGGGRVIDPTTGAQFCYNGQPNVIAPTRISAISAYILTKYIPLPDAANNFYTASPSNIDNRNMYGFRGDYKLGSKHSILGRYLRQHQNLFGPITPSNFAPSGNLQLITAQDYLASDTWTLNDHMINVGRYAQQQITGEPNATSGLSLTTAGYAYSSTNASAAGLPYVSLTGAFTQGDAQQPFAYRGNLVNTISDDFTWTRGKHTFQFGGEIRRDRIDLLYINRPNGAFTYTSNFTGNVLSDFLIGTPYIFQQGSGDPALDGSSWTYSLYAQDQYRVSRRVTIEVGARYEVNRPYVEDNNHLAALHPGQQSTVQPNAPVGLVYPGDANTPRATYNTDVNNVAPRLGVVFDPRGDGKTSVRAAWGIFFDTVPGQGDFFQNGTLAPPFQPLQEIDFYTRSNAAANPNYFANPYLGVAAGPVGFPPGLTFIGWSLPDSFKTARIQQYNLSVQQELTSHMAFELGYVGSHSDFLPIFIEVNPTNVLPTGATTAGLAAYKAGTRAVFPALGLVRPTFAAAGSWYDSLQASTQLRNWHRVHATAAYTWSHSIDDVSGLNIGTDSRPILPVTIGNQASIDAALALERGNSLFDARNRFVLSFGYELPRLESHALAERLVLGGWQVNGIFQVQSGNPFTAVNSSTTAQSLTFRPNETCNPNNLPGRKPGSSNTFFNTACFSLPTTSTGLIDNSHSGNEPRGTIVGPGFNNTDASLFKTFPVREADRIELRFEVFNVFNEAHFAQPGLTFGSPATFGRITSTIGNDQRIIQLAAKFAF
jgi:outer membrane receptor protein involved in Fe transport